MRRISFHRRDAETLRKSLRKANEVMTCAHMEAPWQNGGWCAEEAEACVRYSRAAMRREIEGTLRSVSMRVSLLPLRTSLGKAILFLAFLCAFSASQRLCGEGCLR